MRYKIAPDKWKHFFVGIAMGAVLESIAWGIWPAYPVWASGAVFLIVLGVSYGFELFSLVTGIGHYDVMDAVASIIGGILGMGIGGAAIAYWCF
ncbi:hypothetical protein [Chitinophaga nivalis]|uniref:Uncharacterized protein n=1 Tax=Chitinophaga nivalis TaxID=2991709 RepID=A0ABT3IER2_9BACT|nr:hypothetical protein [Chitinophaga nivalis]MCW3467864.1 hypothetical protein [Chitinophaga nivalis]MCW3482445.1 hypothetical protein [Chitinophaga nivalis]